MTGVQTCALPISDTSCASEAMVFPRAQLVSATEAILTDNGVRAQGSPDMMKVWEGK